MLSASHRVRARLGASGREPAGLPDDFAQQVFLAQRHLARRELVFVSLLLSHFAELSGLHDVFSLLSDRAERELAKRCAT
jgi:hypothetical protein